MQSLFNLKDNDVIKDRIKKLTPGLVPLWGKINVAQMLTFSNHLNQFGG